MAVSFSRPDPSSPAAVASATFSTGRRGFDADEVRDFLRMVSAELGRLQERERFLERELQAAQSRVADEVELDEDTVTRLLGEETARVLSTAREAAAQTRTRAEEGAARLLREAQDEAARLREEIEVEIARRRQDAVEDADAEVAAAKQQGREMVEEARAYRERVLADLAKRREQARANLQQLADGRERLVQAFERARLVTADVLAEIDALADDGDPEAGDVANASGAGARSARSADEVTHTNVSVESFDDLDVPALYVIEPDDTVEQVLVVVDVPEGPTRRPSSGRPTRAPATSTPSAPTRTPPGRRRRRRGRSSTTRSWTSSSMRRSRRATPVVPTGPTRRTSRPAATRRSTTTVSLRSSSCSPASSTATSPWLRPTRSRAPSPTPWRSSRRSTSSSPG